MKKILILSLFTFSILFSYDYLETNGIDTYTSSGSSYELVDAIIQSDDYKISYNDNDDLVSAYVRVGAICNDGWRSYSTGRGTCSHHKGVHHWLYGWR